MNIITSKPIIYSNANGDETPVATKDKKQINPDVLKTSGDVLTGLGTALINRQRSYTDAEQRCGKRPLNKKAREAWQKCVDSNASMTQPTTPAPIVEETPKKAPMSKTTKIALISGGAVLLVIIGYLVYKKSK